MNIASTLIGAVHCPVCNARCSGATASAANPDATPIPGDLSICAFCFSPLVFTEQDGKLGLRKADAEEAERVVRAISRPEDIGVHTVIILAERIYARLIARGLAEVVDIAVDTTGVRPGLVIKCPEMARDVLGEMLRAEGVNPAMIKNYSIKGSA